MKLQLNDLLQILRAQIEGLLERREGKNTQYEVADAALSPFAAFYTQTASFLAYQRKMQDEKGRNNAESMFGINAIPSDSQIRRILDGIGAEELEGIFYESLDCSEQEKLLYRYCLEEQITFTRSRAYKKNDQAHVEQKNWSVVRRTVGYDRWESEEGYLLLQSVYETLRLYVNFFQPVLKLIGKKRYGNRVVRRHDQAKTPYQRVLASEEIPVEVKARLAHQYVHLNPVQLRQDIDKKVAKLWKIS